MGPANMLSAHNPHYPQGCVMAHAATTHPFSYARGQRISTIQCIAPCLKPFCKGI